MDAARPPDTNIVARMERNRQLIGMLHVPVTSILAAPAPWLERLALPRLSAHDAGLVANTRHDPAAAAQLVQKLSFIRFLEDRTLSEADAYAQHGLTAMQLENTGAPYAIGDAINPVEVAVIDHIAGLVRERHPHVSLGLQILAGGGEHALRIAIRRDLDYIRVEGVLFHGIRPEGPLPNSGNLHALYAQRRLDQLTTRGRDSARPPIFVDLLKKHTAFPPELQSLDLWLHNIVFMKLEGVIITGPETGRPADESALAQSAAAVGRVRDELGIFVPLLTGSGVTPENVAMYARYAHGVIAGSCIKKDGYWENPLDTERLARLVAAAARAGFEVG